VKTYHIKHITIQLDDEDVDRISIYKWGVTQRLSIQRFIRGSRRRTKAISLANEIMKTEGVRYDHKDRNPLNFCKNNLRPSTAAQNAHNRKPIIGASIYKGVCKNQGKWVARITINNNRIHLGVFTEEIEAAKAYDSAAKYYHKDFAVLNFKEQLKT
jgi:hypothetical protein